LVSLYKQLLPQYCHFDEGEIFVSSSTKISNLLNGVSREDFSSVEMTKNTRKDKTHQLKALIKTKTSKIAPIEAVSFFAFSAKKIQVDSGTKGL
jgi:hypothetical protein